MSTSCFHCGETVPNNFKLSVLINQQEQPMCCYGCQAVAEAIVDNDLTDFYKYRTEYSDKAEELVPEALKSNRILDDENLQSEFAYSTENGKETILSIDGITCSACAWLIEKQINKLDGINSINVNATTQRATLSWQENKVKLSGVLEAIRKIGYAASPFKANEAEQKNINNRKAFVRRLGVSGILMMQVLMLAFALYFGDFSDISDHNLLYLRWASMLLTLPIVAYGAFPFYQGAVSSIKARHLTMDVPVSIAIILAYSASVRATLSEQGEVYFESVSMFTFLLLIGKFLEFRARSRAAEVSANLLKLMPMTATKIEGDNELAVSAKHLSKNDLVIVKPGETIPGDGEVVSGTSSVNEAMLSGEQLPVAKVALNKVYAGTINGDGNLVVKISNPTQQSVLSGLIRLSESAQNHKPKIAELSDKVAQYFVAVILLTAIGTAIYWHINDPNAAFWITISVLVATCPCALSLATPTALTCATTFLNRHGIMIKSAHVLETLPQVNSYAFDKTGTLTTGQFSLNQVITSSDSYSKQTILALAAALESHSQHPMAQAFEPYRDSSITLKNIDVVASAGLTGYWPKHDVNVAIGKASWLVDENEQDYKDSQCVLAINGDVVAKFLLSDAIRADAPEVINSLKKSHYSTSLLTGDNLAGAQHVLNAIDLDSIHTSLTPEQKLSQLQTMQKQEHIVAMVGDGVNDTPVFGAAHVSISMGSGTDIAKNGADVILLNNQLKSILSLHHTAIKNQTIIKQNYWWAFSYNAIILPLAVCGFVTPYIAVLGMSASSLVVITNSLRLLKK